MPAFRQATTAVMETGYSRAKLAERLADDLGGIVDADAKYWSDLADHTVTKAREVGRVSGYEEAGITHVRIYNPAPVSQICRDLLGRIVEVKVLREQADAILAAKTVDQIKAAQPWIGRYTGSTSEMGKFGLPPFHYKCKSTTEAIVESSSPPRLVDGSRVSEGDKERIRKYTPSEHALRVADIQKKAAMKEGLSYHPKDVKDDIFAHGPDFGIKVDSDAGDAVKEQAKRDLAAVASTAVAQAKEKLVQIYPRGSADGIMQYVYMSENPPMEVETDDGGVIRSCNYIKNFTVRLEHRRQEMIWLKSQ